MVDSARWQNHIILKKQIERIGNIAFCLIIPTAWSDSLALTRT